MDVVGRAHEIGLIEKWLDSGPGPRIGLLGGEMGIGKSTLWSAASRKAAARSYHVLSCRSSESESELPYAGLGDLVGGLADSPAVHALREPLRAALSSVLYWERPEGAPPPRHAVALAMLDLIKNMAAEGPVLIALDDLQWLDRATEVVLAFVMRRLTTEPVKLLATIGTAADGAASWPVLAQALPAGRVASWEAGPLDPQALAEIVESRCGRVFNRSLLRRLHGACGGNPLFGVELARLWSDRSPPSGELRLPESLGRLLRERLRALPPNAAEALLLVACSSRPTIGLVERVTGGLTGLAETIARYWVVLDGDTPRLRVPLLRTVVLEAAGPLRRREMHLRLAHAVNDTEERARHLALTADHADADLADTLDHAAALAAARGDTLAAGDMAAHAFRLTPADQAETGLRRRLDAAAHLMRGGDGLRARAVLEEALVDCPPGPRRAEAHILMARAAFAVGRTADAITVLRKGRAEIVDEPGTLIGATAAIVYYCLHGGELPAAREHARELRRLAEPTGDTAVRRAAAVVEAAVGFLSAAAVPAVVPALPYGLPPGDLSFASMQLHAFLCRCLGDVTGARPAIDALRAADPERRTASWTDWGMVWATGIERLAGDLQAASRYADLAASAVERTGIPSSAALLAEASVLSMRGELDRALRLAEEGLSLARAGGNRLAELEARALLGFIGISADDPMAALLHLDAAGRVCHTLGLAQETIWPGMAADHVEALIRIGRHDQAVERAERLSQAARVVDRPLARGMACRARGVLLTVTGAPKRGVGELEAAAAEFAAAGMPFELGRTLLALSGSHNRLRQREAARRTRDRAVAAFAEIGAEGWAGRAESRPRLIAPGRLTASEARVVALVTEGRTNREVAEELALEVKTVESHLSSAYRKLGVRGRTQLVLHMRSDRRPG